MKLTEDIKELAFSIDKVTVTAKTRALKATWNANGYFRHVPINELCEDAPLFPEIENIDDAFE